MNQSSVPADGVVAIEAPRTGRPSESGESRGGRGDESYEGSAIVTMDDVTSDAGIPQGFQTVRESATSPVESRPSIIAQDHLRVQENPVMGDQD